jgi:hypothetical protein
MIITRYPGRWEMYRKESGDFFECLKKAMNNGKLRCPVCGGSFNVHSYYSRSVMDGSDCGKITIMRVICKGHECGKTQALLPQFLMPYKRYTVDVIENCMRHVESGGQIDTSEAAAESSTIRRWMIYLRNRLLIAMSILNSLVIENGTAIGSMAFCGKKGLEGLSLLVRKYFSINNIESTIGNANIVLTSYGLGYI